MANQQIQKTTEAPDAHFTRWSDTVLGSSLGRWAQKAEVQLCEMVNVHNASTGDLMGMLQRRIDDLTTGNYTLPKGLNGQEVNEEEWLDEKLAQLLNMANNAAGLLEKLSNIHSKLSAGGRTGFAATLAKQLAAAQLMDQFGPDKSTTIRRRFGAGAPQVLDLTADEDTEIDLS